MSADIGLASALTALAGAGINIPELMRKTPTEMSSKKAEDDLLQALDSYVRRETDNPIQDLGLNYPPEKDITLRKALFDSGKLAGYRAGPARGDVPQININPNADRGLLAHEMGHVAFGQTKAGEITQKLRGAAPRTAAALAGAAALSPVLSSYLTPGDDDVAQGVALSLALSSPGIVDEFEANRRGLALLKEAGMPATTGQRARMAGGMLTYLAAPVAIGASGALLGNMFDEDVTLGMG